MIARRENFGGTASSHFLRQATVVKTLENHASVTSQQGVPSTLNNLGDSIFSKNLFRQEKHLTPIGSTSTRVSGAPSPKGQMSARVPLADSWALLHTEGKARPQEGKCARVSTRTHKSLGCSLTSTQGKRPCTRQDHAALEYQVLLHPISRNGIRVITRKNSSLEHSNKLRE